MEANVRTRREVTRIIEENLHYADSSELQDAAFAYLSDSHISDWHRQVLEHPDEPTRGIVSLRDRDERSAFHALVKTLSTRRAASSGGSAGRSGALGSARQSVLRRCEPSPEATTRWNDTRRASPHNRSAADTADATSPPTGGGRRASTPSEGQRRWRTSLSARDVMCRR